MPFVKNICNTTDHPIPKGYSTFEEFWLKMTDNRSLGMCRCCGKQSAEVGGHIIKSDITDKSWYITPLCKKCNNPYNTKTFFVAEIDLAKLHQ